MPREIFAELFVRDVTANLAIFRDVLGFEVVRDEPGFAGLRHGASTLLLNDGTPPGSGPGGWAETPYPEGLPRGGGLELAVVVEDLAECFARAAAAGLRIVVEPRDRPWGRTDFRFLLPDGYYVRVTT